MTEIAAILYVAIIAGVILFQLCLIAGAPWGHLTQGGRYSRSLPAAGRVTAGFSVALLVCMAAGVASAAGMAPNWPSWASWTAVAVQALSTLLNSITPSRAEKILWGPVTAVLLGLALYVVLGASP